MLTLFALSAALLYGGADFAGGAASRRASALAVLGLAAPLGAVVIIVAAAVGGGPFQAAGMGWALAGGAVGGVGLIAFYDGLAAGPMAVVAPLSAVVSTLLPVAVALGMGERGSPSIYAGALACLAAIGLVSMDGGADGADGGRSRPRVSRRTARGLVSGFIAGCAFGLFFVFLRQAGQSGVLWQVAGARVAGTAVVVMALVGRTVWARSPAVRALVTARSAAAADASAAGKAGRARESGAAGKAGRAGDAAAGLAGRRRVLPLAAAAGAMDAAANVCYVLASRAGLFGMAVILTALYPGVTVLLARVVLGERVKPLQRAGLLLALAGIALVTR